MTIIRHRVHLFKRETIALRRCAHCRIISRDVNLFDRYYGGHGYRLVLECTDVTACWQRIDAREARN